MLSAHSVLAKEYQDVLSWISPVVEEHRSTLVAGIPQLNMCDVAVMVSFTGLLQLFCPSPSSVSRMRVFGFWLEACKASQHRFAPSVVSITRSSQFKAVDTLMFLSHFHSLYKHWTS